MILARFVAIGAWLNVQSVATEPCSVDNPENEGYKTTPVRAVTAHHQVLMQLRPESAKQVAIIGKLDLELLA